MNISSISLVVSYLHPNRASANPDAQFVVVNNQPTNNNGSIPTTTTIIDANRSHRLTAPTNSHHHHQYDRPCTALMAHTDDDIKVTNEGSVWIAETMWQMCHIVQMVTTHRHHRVRSGKYPLPSSIFSHTWIQGPCCQQGDVATIRTVQCGDNTTHHDDTTHQPPSHEPRTLPMDGPYHPRMSTQHP